jgi:hypothetical protein
VGSGRSVVGGGVGVDEVVVVAGGVGAVVVAGAFGAVTGSEAVEPADGSAAGSVDEQAAAHIVAIRTSAPRRTTRSWITEV